MPARQARVVLTVIFVATVLIGLSATMLAVALPSIVADLGATSVEGGWMLLAYMVANGSALVLSGQLADSLDLRRVFLTGAVVFTVASGWLTVSSGPAAFIGARALQGIGAAMLLSTAAAAIAVAFPGAERRAAMGIYLAGFAVAQVSGPMVGGVITTVLGWRWIFVAGVVLGAVATVLGWRPLARLPVRAPRPVRVDLLGNALIAGVITLVLMALSGVSALGWLSARTLGELGVAALGTALFVAVEHRAASPAIAVDLLRDHVFTRANLAGMMLAGPRIAPAVILSLWFQGFVGAGPTEAALWITPLAGAVVIGTLLTGRLTATVGDLTVARWTAAGSVAGAALLCAAFVAGGGGPGLVPALVVLGLTTGAFSTVNSTMILGLRGVDQAGAVNGIRTMAQALGLSFGTAVLLSVGTAGLGAADSAAFYAGEAGSLSAVAREQVHRGYVTAAGVVLLMSVVAVVSTWSIRPGRPGLEDSSTRMPRRPL